MKKYTVISISFFLVGIVCFAVTGYAIQGYRDFLDLFANYGINEAVYLKHEETSEIIFNFKFGILKYSLLGIGAWITSIFFLVKRLKKV